VEGIPSRFDFLWLAIQLFFTDALKGNHGSLCPIAVAVYSGMNLIIWSHRFNDGELQLHCVLSRTYKEASDGRSNSRITI
jgi:hypothetical protein